MQNKKRMILLIAWNATVFAVVILAWLWMLVFGNGERFVWAGLRSLRYYTVLSNLLEAFVSLGFAIALARAAVRGKPVKTIWQILKLTAASSVMVTFMVVMLFLGPLYGYLKMLEGADLWFHLLVPLAAAAEYALLDRFYEVSLRRTLWCVTPTILYGVWYVINFLVFGLEGNDFYGFVMWGYGVGTVIAFSIVAMHFGLACLLRTVNKRKT